jgi:hypothetical protein
MSFMMPDSFVVFCWQTADDIYAAAKAGDDDAQFACIAVDAFWQQQGPVAYCVDCGDEAPQGLAGGNVVLYARGGNEAITVAFCQQCAERCKSTHGIIAATKKSLIARGEAMPFGDVGHA